MALPSANVGDGTPPYAVWLRTAVSVASDPEATVADLPLSMILDALSHLYGTVSRVNEANLELLDLLGVPIDVAASDGTIDLEALVEDLPYEVREHGRALGRAVDSAREDLGRCTPLLVAWSNFGNEHEDARGSSAAEFLEVERGGRPITSVDWVKRSVRQSQLVTGRTTAALYLGVEHVISTLGDPGEPVFLMSVPGTLPVVQPIRLLLAFASTEWRRALRYVAGHSVPPLDF